MVLYENRLQLNFILGFEPTTGYERTTLEDLEIMKMGAGFLRDDMIVFAVNTAKLSELYSKGMVPSQKAMREEQVRKWNASKSRN